MVPATGSVTMISMVLFCLAGPGTFRFEGRVFGRFGGVSVPRSLRTLEIRALSSYFSECTRGMLCAG